MIKLKQDSFLLKSENYSIDKNKIDLNKDRIAYYMNLRDYFTDTVEQIQYDNNEEQSFDCGIQGDGFGISFELDNNIYRLSVQKVRVHNE
jgi:hypothetical protein|tara:strand:+ start:58 stop:327 length:270 start_codon:yes stop_codon:yes gene_type:complete